VPGVQLVSVNPNVKAEPVGVGVVRQLPGWTELLRVAAIVIPGVRRGGKGVKEKEALADVWFLGGGG